MLLFVPQHLHPSLLRQGTSGKHLAATTPHIVIPGKPKPKEETYKRCPPWGRSGDPLLSLLKNRIDPASHPHAMNIMDLLHISWPGRVSRQSIPMEYWTNKERRQIYRYEGSPVEVTGYMISFDPSGPPEDANCGGTAGADWHLWLGPHRKDSRKQAAIAEATPRVRAREHGFHPDLFQELAKHRDEVRITGWLFLDTDHPLHATDRATLWEVHPITRVDVWQPGHCKPHHRHCVKGQWSTVAG